MPLEMGNTEIDEIFCSGEVAFHGQPVGVVVAKTFELANLAVALVEISYEKIGKHEYIDLRLIQNNHSLVFQQIIQSILLLKM